jgi:3-hydroxyisobutyrate dehydrogenase-like beta-hydroxyacid dehydrogenase
MKLARNLLHFISFTATAEASRLAEAAGIDIAKLGRVVRHTDAITGGAGAVMLRDTTAPIATDDFWHGVFTHVRGLGEKDLSLALGLADRLGVDLPLGTIALRDLGTGFGVGPGELARRADVRASDGVSGDAGGTGRDHDDEENR